MFRSQANLRTMIEDIYTIANKLEGQQLRERTIRVREITQRKKERESASTKGQLSAPDTQSKSIFDSKVLSEEKSLEGQEVDTPSTSTNVSLMQTEENAVDSTDKKQTKKRKSPLESEFIVVNWFAETSVLLIEWSTL